MTYTVRYRLAGEKEWDGYSHILADDIVVIGGMVLPVRVLILDDQRRVELPMSAVIEFSKERAAAIALETKDTVSKPS